MKSKQNIPEWNKDEVWNNIENRLQQKKKRRLLYWWFSGAASMVLLIGFLLWGTTSADTKTSLDNNSISKLKQQTSSQEIQNSFPQERPIEPDQDSKQQLEAEHSEIKLHPEQEPQTTNNMLTSKSTIKTKSTGMASEKLTRETATVKSKASTPPLSSDQNNFFEKTEREKVADKNFGILAPLPILEKDWSSIVFKRKESLAGQNTSYALVQKKKATTSWWVESGISIGDKPKANSLIESRRDFNCEQFRFMQTNAIGLQKTLNNKWSLKLGVAYQTIYEKYDCLSSSTQLEEIFSEKGTVYNLTEEATYYESGIAILSTTSTRHIIHNNFIHRLSVPVEMAYTLKKQAWSLEPSLGFRFQFFQHFDGILNYYGKHLFDQEKINTTYYSQDFNIGLITSLNFKYTIAQKASLGLGLTYERDGVFNLFEGESFVGYQTIGLRLGYYRSF